LAFHQQAANQLRGDHLSGAGEEGLGERWEVLGGRGGYGSGLGGGGGAWKTQDTLGYRLSALQHQLKRRVLT
jgi:hypothetical protein